MDVRSLSWTLLLAPFLVLPYRWLWVPCAGGAVAMVLRAGASWREVLRRDGTIVAGAPAVLVLRTALDPGWWAPWLVLVGALAWMRPLLARRAAVRWAVAALLAAAAPMLLLRPAPPTAHAPGIEGRVVCAGDSLTEGLAPGASFPAELGRLLHVPVVNAGRANDRAEDLAERYQASVLEEHAAVVLLLVGGNDCLEGTPRAELGRHLDVLVGGARRAGAGVVLVEMPCGVVWNPYAGLYRAVAARHDAVLVPETTLRRWLLAELLARQLLSRPLTVDGVHLSEAGARRMALWLAPHVRRAGPGSHRRWTPGSMPAHR